MVTNKTTVKSKPVSKNGYKKHGLTTLKKAVKELGGRAIDGSVANNVFEGNKGFYFRVPQTRIVNVTGVFQLGPT